MSLLCPVVLVSILSQASWSQGQGVVVRQKSPILLLPGDGGNQLDARRSPGEADWFRLWLDVWQLRSSQVRDWADTIKLHYNTDTRTSSNVAGVETRVPGWGQTESVEYLDPSWSAWVLGDVGNYMHSLVQYFVQLGYTRGDTIRWWCDGGATQPAMTYLSQGRTIRLQVCSSLSGRVLQETEGAGGGNVPQLGLRPRHHHQSQHGRTIWLVFPPATVGALAEQTCQALHPSQHSLERSRHPAQHLCQVRL